MLAMLRKMVELQSALNDLTNGEKVWRSPATKPDYTLAMAQECAELIDHWGWKWWAKQEQNLPDAKMEIVDIFHFLLSEVIAQYGNDSAPHFLAADYIERTANNLNFGHRSWHLAGMEPVTVFRLLGAIAYTGHIEARLFWVAMEKTGMEFEEFSKLYMTKVVLNRFRQERGYKQGTYIKQWQDHEDNYYAMKYAHELDWQDPESADKLYAKLSARYKTVPKAAV
jgi:hypothetical protein